MKVCSIYNYLDKDKSAIAYLVYYENERNFYIEICDNANINNVPMMFALFMKKGIYSLNSEWTKKWVRSRIIPTDRQNLGQILKANNMKYYDEYTLLLKSRGICSHDDFAVEEMPQRDIEKTILPIRWKKNIKDIIVAKQEILVFFNDETTRKYSVNELKKISINHKYVNAHMDDFRVMQGGYELNCNNVIYIERNTLREAGENIPISIEYFKQFAKKNLVNTAEACEILECSRQNIDSLVKREKIEIVHASSKNKMFFKADIHKKLW